MAHKRKDTLTAPVEWWDHLRWFKRRQNKQERKAAVENIKQQVQDIPM